MKVSRDTSLLHPVFLDRLETVLAKSDEKGYHFAVFEAWRSPERQRYLYAKRPRVTRAKPWQSIHQYGLAADIVWCENGRWSWSHKHPWDWLHTVAYALGLFPLSFEKPHLQLFGYTWKDLYSGGALEKLAETGTDVWLENIVDAAERYTRKYFEPKAPDLGGLPIIVTPDRPSLEDCCEDRTVS